MTAIVLLIFAFLVLMFFVGCLRLGLKLGGFIFGNGKPKHGKDCPHHGR